MQINNAQFTGYASNLEDFRNYLEMLQEEGEWEEASCTLMQFAAVADEEFYEPGTVPYAN